jgi:regulator of RNase E activity RraA
MVQKDHIGPKRPALFHFSTISGHLSPSQAAFRACPCLNFRPISPEATMTHQIDSDIRDRLTACSVPAVVSTLFRMGYQNVFLKGIRPFAPTAPTMVGPAMTLRTIPIREDMRTAIAEGRAENLQAKAFNETGPGEVLVCEVAGVTDTALLGDMVATAFHVRGVAGIVLDGGVNDRAAIEGIGLPVYASGDAVLPFTTHRHVTGLNEPIGCGGVAIFPGDVMIGDRNGVAAIPRAVVAEVSEKALEREELEAFCAERLRSGAPLATSYPPNEETIAAFHAARNDG